VRAGFNGRYGIWIQVTRFDLRKEIHYQNEPAMALDILAIPGGSWRVKGGLGSSSRRTQRHRPSSNRHMDVLMDL